MNEWQAAFYSSLIIHQFNSSFRQKLQLKSCRRVMAEEVVDVGGEFDDG